MDLTAPLVAGIAAEYRRRMLDEYLPKIERSIALLSEAQCWQRPGETGNSVANLLMHLDGNVRQWLLVTFAGEIDARDRPFEFAATAAEQPVPVAELLRRLRDTVTQSVVAVEALDAAALLRQYPIQCYDETGLTAVLHVLEHFSGHAGQIYAWTKQLTGKDLQFYDL